MRQTYPPTTTPYQNYSNQQHYLSLQSINQINKFYEKDNQRSLYEKEILQTTGSGSIFIENVTTATKLLQKLRDEHEMNEIGSNLAQGQLLIYDDNICIEVEWNDMLKHLVLRRLSGDVNSYNTICHQLISSLL